MYASRKFWTLVCWNIDVLVQFSVLIFLRNATSGNQERILPQLQIHHANLKRNRLGNQTIYSPWTLVCACQPNHWTMNWTLCYFYVFILIESTFLSAMSGYTLLLIWKRMLHNLGKIKIGHMWGIYSEFELHTSVVRRCTLFDNFRRCKYTWYIASVRSSNNSLRFFQKQNPEWIVLFFCNL